MTVNSQRRAAIDLFLLSVLVLHAELVVIRWLASEVRVFAYFKNLPLMASFLGLGLGLLRPGSRRLVRSFPPVFGGLAILIAFAAPLGLVHLRFPATSVALWYADAALSAARATLFVALILAIFFWVVAAFAGLGARLGTMFGAFPPLRAYSINVAGSLAGIALFSLVCLGRTGPATWLALVAILVLWFDRSLLAVASVAVVLAALPWAPRADRWSPYYRIDFRPTRLTTDQGPLAVGYLLEVNHDYHQRALNLSRPFLDAHPELATNTIYRQPLLAYALPHAVVPDARRVLVVGAGTGNDVAAALRAGAEHVDAVEIDPVILEIGRQAHPENPYGSPRVTAINTDARAFFRRSHGTYDLIVYGLLDSHTMFSSLSSLRLDNYVYTVESFEEALRHLSPRGVIAVSFSVGVGDWIGQRLQDTIARASGSPPLAITSGYDDGVTFFAGPGLDRAALPHVPRWEPKGEREASASAVRPATDAWPFLYIRPHGRPTAYVLVLGGLLAGAGLLVRQGLRSRGAAAPAGADDKRLHRHLFLLGAGFMLVEVKSVAELSLLFGSTWLVNSAVFAGILVMILGANALVSRRDIRRPWPWYVGLFASLALPFAIPLEALNGLSFPARAAVGALLCSLPIFFAGVLFATSFRKLADPSSGLAWNLLGAMVGGVLEYASMAVGIPALNVVALALYALSLVALRGATRAAPMPPPAAAT